MGDHTINDLGDWPFVSPACRQAADSHYSLLLLTLCSEELLIVQWYTILILPLVALQLLLYVNSLMSHPHQPLPDLDKLTSDSVNPSTYSPI
jgi:hypothetical protein